MGQYYITVITDEDGKIIHIIHPSEGVKMMEHAYYSSYNIRVVYSILEEMKCKVFWLGDYASKRDYPNHRHIIRAYYNIEEMEKFRHVYDPRKDVGSKSIRYYTSGYLINHTKKQYINLTEYYFGKRRLRKNNDPLPILTEMTSETAGGDYTGINEEYKGYWLDDILSYSEESPDESYTKLDIEFNDGHYTFSESDFESFSSKSDD